MKNQADIIRTRFEEVNREFTQYSNGKVYGEPSKIRIEVPILAGVGRYNFDIKKTDIKNQREISLNRNDVFVPNFLGVFLAIQNDTKPSSEILASFPVINDGVNPSPYAAGFQNTDIEALYNGKLTWLVDNGVLMSAYPTERFKHVPERQGGFVLNSQDAAVNELTAVEWDVLDACDLVVPKLIIAGTRDHNVSVNFDASGLTFPTTTGYTPYLVFYMDGTLIKGGCEFFEGANPEARAIGNWGGK